MLKFTYRKRHFYIDGNTICIFTGDGSQRVDIANLRPNEPFCDVFAYLDYWFKTMKKEDTIRQDPVEPVRKEINRLRQLLATKSARVCPDYHTRLEDRLTTLRERMKDLIDAS